MKVGTQHIQQSHSSKQIEPSQKFSVEHILLTRDRGGAETFNALSFEQQLQLVLECSGRDRVALVQLSDRFEELVRAMPAEEILLTIADVGAQEGFPLIAATSYEQFEFLTDIKMWQADRLHPEKVSEWLQILAECSDEKILDWLHRVDEALLASILKKTIGIYKSDEEFTPPEQIPDEHVFTLDGLYYFYCPDQQLLPALRKIFIIFRTHLSEAFVATMEAVIWENLVEVEEEAYQRRQNRLAEKGFTELDEALKIYTYMDSTTEKRLLQRMPVTVPQDQQLIAPRYPVKLQDQRMFLIRSLRQVDDPRILERFWRNLSILANKIQVADGMELGSRECMEASARKAAGYIAIGLEVLSQMNPSTAAQLAGRLHVEHLFQVGFSRIEKVARKARKLLHQGWLSTIPNAVELLDSPWREIFKGLVKSRSQYFIGNQKLTLNDYRDFQTRTEIQAANQTLDEVEYQGHLLCHYLGLTAQVVEEMRRRHQRWIRTHDFRFSTLFLTAVAKYLLGQAFSVEPLSVDDFRNFLTRIRRHNSQGTVIEGLNPEVKKQLVEYLTQLGCPRDEHEYSLFQKFIDFCWKRLEDELGRVNLQAPVDPRYITVIVVSKT